MSSSPSSPSAHPSFLSSAPTPDAHTELAHLTEELAQFLFEQQRLTGYRGSHRADRMSREEEGERRTNGRRGLSVTAQQGEEGLGAGEERRKRKTRTVRKEKR
mmetsp:Transcript_47693/g.88486  ORF Transcript_47693/g.88486 Transcript_47693/m.88486 type:complete len:103 (-) Transcript_47693:780-1088(-)